MSRGGDIVITFVRVLLAVPPRKEGKNDGQYLRLKIKVTAFAVAENGTDAPLLEVF